MIGAMTERGLPIVDGAPACPFVAFDEDRDGRATAPDHRHRCYAEPRPAPRALAHQEAYCLSSAFPVCPTFQDWARREAAAARAAEPPRPDRERERELTPPPVSRPLGPMDREPRHAPADPQRNPPRSWQAPPPWNAEEEARAARRAAGEETAEEVDAPPFLAGRSDREVAPWGAEGRGLAGSAADRLAGGPSAPEPEAEDEDDDGGWVAAAPALPGRRPAPRMPEPRPAARDREAARQDRLGPRGHVRERREEPSDLFGPAWERPQRYEAYPRIRTRLGIPPIPRPLVAFAALVLAAVVLFFVGPMLLGIGTEPGPGASPTTGAPASGEPTDDLEPTPTPAPTPQSYVVQSGDTLTRIANRFGVTVEEILAANPQIANPNRIAVGDEIVIPIPLPTELPNQLPGVETPIPGAESPAP